MGVGVGVGVGVAGTVRVVPGGRLYVPGPSCVWAIAAPELRAAKRAKMIFCTWQVCEPRATMSSNVNPTAIGNPISGAAGALTNGTFCTLIAPIIYGGSGYSLLPTALASPLYCQMFDAFSYTINLGAGVTAGLVTFQELFWDMTTWVSLATPTIAALVTATNANYNGNVGPGAWLGLRIVTTGVLGGTINNIMLKASIRSL